MYSAPVTCESAPNMLTIDGVNTAMGRFPDTGWLTIDSFVTNTTLTDVELDSCVTDWTGAEVVIRKNHWVIDRCSITDHTGQTLTYTSPSIYDHHALKQCRGEPSAPREKSQPRCGETPRVGEDWGSLVTRPAYPVITATSLQRRFLPLRRNIGVSVSPPEASHPCDTAPPGGGNHHQYRTLPIIGPGTASA